MSDWIVAGFQQMLVRDLAIAFVTGFLLGAICFGLAPWVWDHVEVRWEEVTDD